MEVVQRIATMTIAVMNISVMHWVVKVLHLHCQLYKLALIRDEVSLILRSDISVQLFHGGQYLVDTGVVWPVQNLLFSCQ